MAKLLVFQAFLNTHNGNFFPSTHFCASHRLLFFMCAIFFLDFELSVTTKAPKKSVPAKRHSYGSTSQVAPPLPNDTCRFISGEAERLYHESLCIHSFVPKRGFFDLECILQFHHSDSRLADLVSSPDPRSGPSCPQVLFQPAIPGWHHSVCPR